MEASKAPYRETTERPPLADEDRRWFTKSGDVVKGPYEADALVRSVKRGKLKSTTLVRSEDQDDTAWRPVSKIDFLSKATASMRARNATFDPRSALAPEELGSFGWGFAFGFLLSFPGLALVWISTTAPKTRRGAWSGLLVSVLFAGTVLLIRVLAL